jgi:predicted MPP superfamily phosphohydrolase
MNKIFILIALAVYGSINFYLFRRAWQALPANSALHAVFIVVFIILSLSFFVSMALGERLPEGVTVVLENIGAYWIIGLLYFILAALFADLIRGANHFIRFYPDWVYVHYQSVKTGYFLGVLGLFILFSLVGNYRFRHPSIRELNLEIPAGEAPKGSFTMVLATDVHLGNIIRKNRLKKYVKLINDQKADLILFGGDLIDHSIRPVISRQMDEELRELSAPSGVYGIFGNHEYYGDPVRAAQFYERAGIHLLRDSAVVIGNRLVLVGREDISQRHRKLLDDLLKEVPPGLPRILLDHNPSRLQDAARNGIALQLSGHTHDGQIFPLNLLVRRMYALSYGFMKRGETNYYVSSGLGLWAAPVRIGTHSEIVRIKLDFI